MKINKEGTFSKKSLKTEKQTLNSYTCKQLKFYDCLVFSRIINLYPLVAVFEFLFMFMCIACNPKKDNIKIFHFSFGVMQVRVLRLKN